MNASDVPQSGDAVIRKLSLDSLDHPEDKRSFLPEILDRLQTSIAAVGLLHYPVVIPDGDRFEIVAGNHRIEALRLGGGTDVYCHVLPEGTTPEQALMCSLHENYVRRNESVADTMKRVTALMTYHGCQTFAEGAKLAGLDESTVSKVRLVMGKLSPRCLAIVHEKKLGIRTCYEIAKYGGDEEEQFLRLQSHRRGETPRAAKVQRAEKKRSAAKLAASARTRTAPLPKPPRVRVHVKRDDIDLKLDILESAEAEAVSAVLTAIAEQLVSHYRAHGSLSAFSYL